MSGVWIVMALAALVFIALGAKAYFVAVKNKEVPFVRKSAEVWFRTDIIMALIFASISVYLYFN